MGRKESNQTNKTLCLLVSSADNLFKQFGTRSGPTKCRAWSGSNLVDTQMVYYSSTNFSKKLILKKSADSKKACKITQYAKRWEIIWLVWVIAIYTLWSTEDCEIIIHEEGDGVYHSPDRQKHLLRIKLRYLLICQFKHVFCVLKRTV